MRSFLFVLCLWTSVVLCAQSSASNPVRAEKIAVLLWHDSPNDLAALKGLKRGLAAMKLGGQIIELHADADEEKAQRLLREAREKGARLFIALGTRATRIAASEIKDLPIVFTAVTNPVLSGITPSWQGSRTNVCGNSNWLDRREMLASFRQALPSMKRLVVLRTPENTVSRAEVEEARRALAASPGLQLVELQVPDADAVEQVLRTGLEEADAVWVPIDFPLYQERPLKSVVKAARRRGIPVFSSTPKCAGAGATVVMTVDYELLGLRASALVRDILKRGRSPGTIPVGRLKSSRLFIDLAAARAIRLKLPFELILSAHRLFGAEDG